MQLIKMLVFLCVEMYQSTEMIFCSRTVILNQATATLKLRAEYGTVIIGENTTQKPYGAGNIESVTIKNMNVHWSSKPNRYRDALILCETVVNNLSILNFNRNTRKDKAKKFRLLSRAMYPESI